MASKKKKKSKKKKHKIQVNRTQICDVDQNQLPPDARFKGYQSVVVQDILIQPNNTEFKKKVYYSPSLNKTFTAKLPEGYCGEFGPKIKARYWICTTLKDDRIGDSHIFNQP